jgi:hypothetical protein
MIVSASGRAVRRLRAGCPYSEFRQQARHRTAKPTIKLHFAVQWRLNLHVDECSRWLLVLSHDHLSTIHYLVSVSDITAVSSNQVFKYVGDVTAVSSNQVFNSVGDVTAVSSNQVFNSVGDVTAVLRIRFSTLSVTSRLF